MCIAYLALGQPGWPVLIAANRDEFHARPTAAAGPWPGHPEVIAGRDLSAGGTWLGQTKGGRYALLTNYREPEFTVPEQAPSRGVLVRDFLLEVSDPALYVHDIARRASDWAGFNLILGDTQQSWYLSNRDPKGVPRRLAPGRYVLSNHLLDTPWPKSERLRSALDAIPAKQWAQHPEEIIKLLRDTNRAEQAKLPNTGLSPELEYLLSSSFIISDNYGTRCSSVIAVNDQGHSLFSEHSYDAAGLPQERHDWRF